MDREREANKQHDKHQTEKTNLGRDADGYSRPYSGAKKCWFLCSSRCWCTFPWIASGNTEEKDRHNVLTNMQSCVCVCMHVPVCAVMTRVRCVNHSKHIVKHIHKPLVAGMHSGRKSVVFIYRAKRKIGHKTEYTKTHSGLNHLVERAVTTRGVINQGNERSSPNTKSNYTAIPLSRGLN